MSSNLTEDQQLILYGAAEALAKSREIEGMCVAAQISYIILDSDGDETIGGVFQGGLMNALGLATWQQARILEDKDTDEEETT